MAIAFPLGASANTAANSYTPTGQSWISVAESAKVYLENFGGTDYDDNELYYVGVGITCTSGGVTASGPFITAESLSASDCVDSQSNPVNPIDTAQRQGAVPFGFDINFFGTTYDSAWPNTNGGIFFDAPDSNYDTPMAQLAFQAGSSVMFPLGADLYYFAGESNFWTAQATIDGSNAVIFTWENFHNCCNSAGPEDMSFQLVLIDQGNGDFNAYFNYDSFNLFNQGYDGPAVFIDLETGVTVGSNIAVTEDAKFVSATCTEATFDTGSAYGTPTDSQFANDATSSLYFKLEDVTANTISLWTDNACSAPLQPTAVQDVATDGYAYLEFQDNNATYRAVTVGWATFTAGTGRIDWTELLRNADATELENTAVNPLNLRSLNTSVPGRFVIGQRGGQTVTDQGSLGGGTDLGTPNTQGEVAALAVTGLPADSYIFVGVTGFIGVILGAWLVRRKKASL